MHKISSVIAVQFLFFIAACASAPPAKVEKVETKRPSVTEAATLPGPTVLVAEEGSVKTIIESAAAKSTQPVVIPTQIWHVKNGKLEGATTRPPGKVISKVKNKKGNGFTVDLCYDYGSFAIFETKSTDEVGSAELYVRHKDSGPPCAVYFKGDQKNLKLREGTFAGVAGEYVVTDGADASEYMLESQIFALEGGEEVLRILHDPTQDYQLTLKGSVLSATFHSKVGVKCELPSEGKECWKRVVEENKLPRSIKMPDCTGAFAAAKKSLEEPALVTVKTRIQNVRKPKNEYLAGSANCAPEP